MKRIVQSTLVLGALALVTPAVLAQRPGGFGGGFGGGTLFLLTQKSVQDELKMTDEQVKKVTELQAKEREARGPRDPNVSREERQKKAEEARAATDKALTDILKPEQLKRVKQISWQRQGTRALSDKEVAEALKLTDEQKEKLKTIQDDARKEMRDLFQAGAGNRDEARKKMEELRKSADEKAQAVLTAEQKTKLKEVTGEPFKGEIKLPEFGRRNRPGGQGAPRQPPKDKDK
jgi:Spy/CpxP family protein refolding chaperone